MGIGNIATSGMQATMTDMEVISNNIANAGTWAFKASYTNFADVYPAGVSNAPGLGVSVTGIQQNFSRGGPVSTGGLSDLCILNDCFFVMKDATSSQTSYSRYGRFGFDNGYFTVGNQRLQGFTAVNGAIPSGSTVADLFVDTAPMAASASTTVNQVNLNLDAADDVPTTTPFDPTDKTSFNFASTAIVYDSLGTANTLDLYYVKTSANNWTVNAYANGTSIGTGSMVFDGATGSLSSTSGLTGLTFTPTSGAPAQSFDLVMTGATQYSSISTAKPFTSNGYAAGTYVGYNIDKNGMVTANYSNNKSLLIGQVALAKFQSPEGLQNIGNMSWEETTLSGAPDINQNNSQSAFQTSSLEAANVDLAAEMVKLITVQNNFQANAQVQKAYNEVMQTVTQL